MKKAKLWMSWWWNSDLYYCKVPDRTVYESFLERMGRYTAADAEAWFSEIVLLETEPQIGEYLPRKKLETFLDNMDRFRAEREEHTAIESMEEMLDAFFMENNL